LWADASREEKTNAAREACYPREASCARKDTCAHKDTRAQAGCARDASRNTARGPISEGCG
jgi:hypothetical protein